MAQKASSSEKSRWSGCAKTYTTCLKIIPEYFARIAAEILANIDENKIVQFVDIAGGPGTLTLEFARILKEKFGILEGSSFICTDFAPGMVEIALQNIAKESYIDDIPISASIMDAQAIALGSQTITDIGCMFGVMFFPDRIRAYQEFLRVLIPGGRCVIGTWQHSDIVDIWTDFMKTLNVDPTETLQSLECVSICSDPRAFEQELLYHGFCNVHIEECSHIFEMPNTRDTFISFASNAVLNKSIRHLDADSLWIPWQQFIANSQWISDVDHFHVRMVANIAICYAPQ